MIYKRIAQERSCVGDIMTGRGTAPLTDRFSKVEAILERNKPSNAPNRGQSVFMRDDEDFSGVGVTYSKGYVHVVEPVGSVFKRDTYWIGVLQKRYIKDRRFRNDLESTLSDDEVAKNYWTGHASAKPIWEWVAEKVKVIHAAKNPVDVKPNSPLLNALLDSLRE